MAPFETGPPADLMAPGMNSEFLSRPFISCRPFNILQEKRWFETHSHDSRKLSSLSLLCFLVHVAFTRLCASAKRRKSSSQHPQIPIFHRNRWMTVMSSTSHLTVSPCRNSIWLPAKEYTYYCSWLVGFGCNPLFWRISMPKALFEILNDIVINVFFDWA